MKSTSGGRRETADTVRRAAWICLAVNLSVTLLKGAAGVLSRSRALTADAVHSLSDLSTDIAVLVGSRYWTRPADKTHPMGHSGIETAVAMFIGLVLIAAGAGIGWDSFLSLRGPSHGASPGSAALLAAVVSFAAKELLYRWTRKKSIAVRSAALAANATHARTDAISSIPVILAVGVSHLYPSLTFVDSLGGMVVSVFVVVSGVKILRPCLQQLTNSAPSDDLVKRIGQAVTEQPGVAGYHRLRARMQAGGVFVDLHVQVEGRLSIERAFLIARSVEGAIMELDPSIIDVMARVEPWAPCGDVDRCFRDI